MRFKIIFFLLFFFINISNHTYANIDDKIIAKIGSDIITNYDIVNEINTILALSNRTAKPEEFNNLRSIAFTSLKKKIIKKAEIEKFKIANYNELDVNNYIINIEKSLGLQNLSLEDQFKRYGANYNLYLEGVILGFKWNTLIYSLYRKQLDVDEELIKSELNKQIQKKREVQEYNLSEIVLQNYDENKLNTILESIKLDGFEKTANIYSNSISSSKGGSIGWVSSQSISNNYLKEIVNLSKKQISKPIKINNNIVIIKLNDKRTLNQNDMNIAKIEGDIIQRKKEEKLNIFSDSHYLDIEKKSYIEIK